MCAVCKRLVIAACVSAALACGVLQSAAAQEDAVTALPDGVEAVWDLDGAYRESTSTRERICINGLWRWQPAREGSDAVPTARWGYFKVPGCWPGITNYMQKDCQTVHAHPSHRWDMRMPHRMGGQDENLGGVAAAWYQREITVPREWTGRRIVLEAEYVNSFAAVYVDGKKAGEIRFPAGEVDLTAACRPGRTHVLSMLVVAMPLEGVMLSYSDTASARKVKGRVARRGLCGDVYLASTPPGPRITDVKADTSVRKWRITLHVALEGLAADRRYVLRANVGGTGMMPVARGQGSLLEFTSEPFKGDDLKNGRITLTEQWKPDKLWDVHTPENVYYLHVSLVEVPPSGGNDRLKPGLQRTNAGVGGQVLDAALPVRFGFREFWIDGRDFYLNGTRIFLSSVPLDNAQIGAAWATYDAARESIERLKSFGINFVYTHNYGCQPGDHLSFEEVLRAADDAGMLVAFSQPHFGHYKWDGPDADRANGYARHAAFYVRVAQNHPSVVAYSTSHNATGYAEDMNPDMIDGVNVRRNEWSARNVQRARRAEAIIKGLDPGRIVYHHSSGNLGAMHTVNFYANFAPAQEMSDWFEHWATEGVKPIFTCEYMVPMSWDWTMYRGWYQGHREFGSATVPWEFCLAEWNAQFFGDRAYQISEEEKENLRWEAEQFRRGGRWHRWDYPHQVGSTDFKERYPVYAAYFSDNWPAFRTWGMSANSPWSHGHYWTLREGVDTGRREFAVDWQRLQRPGFSPDYIEDRYERMDLAFERSDWIPTVAAKALLRYNRPLLAYIAGSPSVGHGNAPPNGRGAFTSKDHNFYPGETVEKQLIVINNSRQTVSCDCQWSFGLAEAVAEKGDGTLLPERPGGCLAQKGPVPFSVATGEQQRIPLRFELPARLTPGRYELSATARFSTGQTQEDSFTVDVLPRPAALQVKAKIALFDPQGETGRLLETMGVSYGKVNAESDLASYDVLIVGKNALTVSGPAPDVTRVPNGLKVLLFEQTPDVLEKRFGFRVATYGLRWVFKRLAEHPILAGVGEEHLRNWRGEATIVPPRLDYRISSQFGAPTVRWCGIPVTRLWRCGNRGNVASVLIEKPPRGDFLPILDGGYSLQYSPLLEYREGNGMLLFCQLDVTGRTESDPAAETLARNVLDYVSAWKPTPRRKAVYVGDPAGKSHLESAGISLKAYESGKLARDDVLVVGTGGGRKLAGDAARIADWLAAGGHVLALGLDQQEANAFLPMKVRMQSREHIATFFEPFAPDSLLAGVAPADVHNPAPRQLPLLSGDTAVGNGVLGKAKGANVVFCQLPPYSVSNAQGAVPSLAVSEDDAVDGQKSALVTMGTVAWGQFGQKIEAGEVGKTYTFAVFVKALGGPVSVRLEVERAGSPWDRAVRGEDTLLPADEWTELDVTFKVDKPYPEGWSAYIHCGQEGARLRADQFRLYEGNYVPAGGTGVSPVLPHDTGKMPVPPGRKNLFANPSFEAGTEPWFFSYRAAQHNLKRTYRRTCFLVARLLANMGVAGSTPILERFSSPVGGATGIMPVPPSVVKNGDFSLDADDDGTPDEWLFSSGSKQATCRRERTQEGGTARCLVLACPPVEGDLPSVGHENAPPNGRPSVMLAQHDVPVVKDQWYRVSFRARAERLTAGSVTMTITNTATWRSFFEYQRFVPGPEWERFSFEVQSNDTADQGTRLQIWYGGSGELWLSDVCIEPITDPSEGRWLDGLYLDVPEEWDDPYRFFRW